MPGTHGKELNCLASEWGLERQLSAVFCTFAELPTPIPPTEMAGRHHSSFAEHFSPAYWHRQAPNLSLNQTYLPCDSLRTHLTSGHFSATVTLKWLTSFHTVNIPKTSERVHKPLTSSGWPQHPLYFLLSRPQPGTTGGWLWFVPKPLLDASKPSTSSYQLQITL